MIHSVYAQHDDLMASDAGVGFTDVGTGIPGTVSSQFDSATFQSWGAGFYARLAAHMARASDSIGYATQYLGTACSSVAKLWSLCAVQRLLHAVLTWM